MPVLDKIDAVVACAFRFAIQHSNDFQCRWIAPERQAVVTGSTEYCMGRYSALCLLLQLLKRNYVCVKEVCGYFPIGESSGSARLSKQTC